MSVPDDLKYTSDHEWLRIEEAVATVGITAFAADSLGEVVFVDLPTVGSTVTAGTPCGEVESTKSVSDVVAPADGEVVAVNAGLTDRPELINSDPYGAGWLFQVRIDAVPSLLDAQSYAALVDGQ